MDVSPLDFAIWAMPIFLAAIAVEVVVSWRRHPERYALGTALSDMAVGGVYQGVEVCVHGMLLVAYAVVFERAAVLNLPVDAWWTWLIGLLGVDLLFYWWHRMSHVVNALWAVHGVHHQGEDFNLAVALRQPAFEPLTWFLFYIPLAVLGLPPEVYIGSYAVNRFYQFWIHTEYVHKGPRWFEWLFNTASHHRVHHGVNEAYLDKNYGAVLIVWDRIFGTFEPEGVRPTYGTTEQLGSYNPVWANLQHFMWCGRMALSTPRWRDRLWVWFAHPAWRPEGCSMDTSASSASSKPERLIAPKYRPPTPSRIGAYVLVQFLLFAPSVTALVRLQDTLSAFALGLGAALVVVGQMVLIGVLERRAWATAGELLRLAAVVAAGTWLFWNFAPVNLREPLMALHAVVGVASAVVFVWTRRGAGDLPVATRQAPTV